jgi:ubiquinone biosynthesis protein
MFFKSLISIEGMGRMILRDFDFLSYSLEFAKELVVAKVDPRRMFSDASVVARDLNSLIAFLPRQLKQALRRLNDPDFHLQVRISEFESLGHSIERSAWIIFWGLVISACALGLLLRP